MLARVVCGVVSTGYARAARLLPIAVAPRPALALYGARAPWTPVDIACRWLSAGSAKGSRKSVVLREEDLDESFVKGSGKGGQKINKVRNCVLLKHVPTGLLVRCQKTRSLDDNRRVARKLLLQKLDDHVNGVLSARSVKIDRLRKKKKAKRARAKQKYGGASSDQEEEETGEDEEEENGSDDGSDGEHEVEDDARRQ